MRRLLCVLALLSIPGTASAASAEVTQARLALERSLGPEGVLQLDPATLRAHRRERYLALSRDVPG